LQAIGRETAVASTMIIAGTGIAIGTSAMIVAMTEIGATIGIAARKGTGGMPGPRSVDRRSLQIGTSTKVHLIIFRLISNCVAFFGRNASTWQEEVR